MHTHGTDGRVISDTENPHSFSHTRIRQAADRMAPGEIATPVDAWGEIAAIVTGAADRFEAAVSRAVELGWEGAAADAALPRVRALRTGLGDLGAALEAQTGPLRAAAGSAARFRAAIPAAVETASGSDAARARNAAEEQARDDMANLYLRPYAAIAPTLPSFPSPGTVLPGSVSAPGGGPQRLIGAAVYGGEHAGVEDLSEGGAGEPDSDTGGADVADGADPARLFAALQGSPVDGSPDGTPAGAGGRFDFVLDEDRGGGRAPGGDSSPGAATPGDSGANAGGSGDGREDDRPTSTERTGVGRIGDLIGEELPEGGEDAGDQSSSGGGDGRTAGSGGAEPGGGTSADAGSGGRADLTDETAGSDIGETAAASAGQAPVAPAAAAPPAEPAGRQYVPPATATPAPAPAPASTPPPWGGGAPQYNAPAPAAPGFGTSPAPGPAVGAPTLSGPSTPAPMPPAAAPAPAPAPAPATATPTPPPSAPAGDRPLVPAPSVTAAPANPASPGTSNPPPRPGISLPPQPAAVGPSATPPPAAQIPRTTVTGLSGYGGMLAAARLSAKADTEHYSPDYLRTPDHGHELLGEREKTAPQALGADDRPQAESQPPHRPQSTRNERELLGGQEKTVPQAIGADDRPVGVGDAAIARVAGHRRSVLNGRELLGEPEKTVPPAIGADDHPARTSNDAVTDGIPRIADRGSVAEGQDGPQRPVLPTIGAEDRPIGVVPRVSESRRSPGHERAEDDRAPSVLGVGGDGTDVMPPTGDCSLNLPPIEPPAPSAHRAVPDSCASVIGDAPEYER